MKAMMKLLRAVLVTGLLTVLAAPVMAQQAMPVQNPASLLDAATTYFAPTPALNQATTTITLPAMAGQCAYIDSLLVSFGSNATGVTGVQTFTSTNLGGVGWSFFPVVVVTSPVTPYLHQQLVGATPFRAAACGTAVTVVSPSGGVATNAYPMLLAAHYSP